MELVLVVLSGRRKLTWFGCIGKKENVPTNLQVPPLCERLVALVDETVKALGRIMHGLMGSEVSLLRKLPATLIALVGLLSRVATVVCLIKRVSNHDSLVMVLGADLEVSVLRESPIAARPCAVVWFLTRVTA